MHKKARQAELRRLRAWAFGDGCATRRVMVIDRIGEHITQTYTVNAVAGVFGAQDVALQQFMQDNAVAGRDFRRFLVRLL